MFIFMPPTEDQKGYAITDNLFLFIFFHVFKKFKNRRKRQ